MTHEASLTIMQERLADLKRKYRARAGRIEYRDNLPMIQAEIERLEASLREHE